MPEGATLGHLRLPDRLPALDSRATVGAPSQGAHLLLLGDGTSGFLPLGRTSRPPLMDAPGWEELIRLVIALVATGTFAFLVQACRRMNGYDAAPLVTFLTAVVGINAAWRWFILWIGLEVDADGTWSRDVEPYVRSIGNAFLILLYVSIGLLAWFHSRRTR